MLLVAFSEMGKFPFYSGKVVQFTRQGVLLKFREHVGSSSTPISFVGLTESFRFEFLFSFLLFFEKNFKNINLTVSKDFFN